MHEAVVADHAVNASVQAGCAPDGDGQSHGSGEYPPAVGAGNNEGC